MRRIALIVLAWMSGPVSGYEVSTHAAMTNQAYQRSELQSVAPDGTQARLGFQRLSADVFGSPLDASLSYFDNLPNDNDPALFPRQPLSTFESGLIGRLLFVSSLQPFSGETSEFVRSLPGWLVRGVIREDDLCCGQQEAHDNDLHGNIFRVFSHFFDPISGAALSNPLCGSLFGPCLPALQWASGEVNPLAVLPTEDTARRNHFTWQDARNNYWWALTLQRDRGGNGLGADDRRLDSQERIFRMATAIRSLGSVVHLVQDMAQPQHSRIDPHSFLQDEPQQTFEPFTDLRVTRDFNEVAQDESVLRHLDGGFPSAEHTPSLITGNYPTVRFSTLRKYFTTKRADGSDSVATRRGIADYSNRGFFTAGTMPDTDPDTPAFADPPTDFSAANGYSTLQVDSTLYVNGSFAKRTVLLRAVPDSVAPTYSDVLPTAYGGKVPVLTRALFGFFCNSGCVNTVARYQLDLPNYIALADVLIPRAVAYSTGLINHFFRGRLDVLPPETGSFAVMNQTEPHTVDADGYPRRTSDNKVHGFEKVRLRVRNATPAVVESGTNESFPQYIGQPSGVVALQGQLVAIARYHRNLCYRPDLAGERLQGFAAPPSTGAITEPTCPSGKRSTYQEISVSAPLTITSPTANTPSELDNLAAGTGVEKLFDFSTDPIPVNATDLFIQVVYRGRMGIDLDGAGIPGNLERDAIAVGTYDAREPTFITFWNNTDFYNQNGTWQPWNFSFPIRTTTSFWVCVGSPSRLAWTYFGAIKGDVAMGIPPNPGYVRMAFITGVPSISTSQWAFRGTPDSVETPKPVARSVFTRGQIKQANKEQISTTSLNSPIGNCDSVTPTTPEHWCQDAIQRRRGVMLGMRVQPIYQEPIAASNAVDVDQPPLPAFSAAEARTGGSLRYNTDATLVSCPNQTAASLNQIELIKLLEELGSIGGAQ